MFQGSFVLGLGGLVAGFFRRWKYPELIIDSDDEEDDDEIDKKLQNTMVKLNGEEEGGCLGVTYFFEYDNHSVGKTHFILVFRY